MDARNPYIIQKLISARIKANIEVKYLAKAIGVTESEYIAYEKEMEEIPASIVFLASVILTNDPLHILEEAGEIFASEDVNNFMAVVE